jgi:glycosyltransferase involved in cell wall biosynthesis
LFYGLAQALVFPSIYEGFGLPPLEAMACGTPVVCSNAASLPEVVGDAAVMFDPYSTDDMANAMHRILEDADLRQTLRERGLRRAAVFTWERTARETVKVYERVLGRA